VYLAKRLDIIKHKEGQEQRFLRTMRKGWQPTSGFQLQIFEN